MIRVNFEKYVQDDFFCFKMDIYLNIQIGSYEYIYD